MKNKGFARFARVVLIFGHFADVFVLSAMWNDLFCSYVDDLSIWWQMFNFVVLIVRRWFQLIPGQFKHILQAYAWLRNDYKNAKLDFQMIFSLPSTFCLLKLPNRLFLETSMPSFSQNKKRPKVPIFSIDGLLLSLSSCPACCLLFCLQTSKIDWHTLFYL